MFVGYTYEVWNGKKVIGRYNISSSILGRFLIVPEVSIFKQSYYKKATYIRVPVIYQFVSDNGIEVTYKRVLDVRKKSKRQIKILIGVK